MVFQNNSSKLSDHPQHTCIQILLNLVFKGQISGENNTKQRHIVIKQEQKGIT